MKQELEQAIAVAVNDLFTIDATIELSRPDEQFGDYATNIALQVSKAVGQNPRTIAEELAEKLRADLANDISNITVAGPGFINFSLNDRAMVRALSSRPTQTQAGRVILVEYSDPNPLKPLHAGHLYTTLVGDSIARLLEITGANVTRLNYGGDVGLHVGKSLWAIIRALGGEYPEKLSAIDTADRPQWLGARYVEGNNAYEDNETAKQQIVEVNKRVYKLHEDQDQDSPFAQIYWTVRQWSYDYFAVLYQQLQVTPFNRFIPESEVTALGLQIVRAQLEKGVYQESQGAIVFDGEQYGLHTRVFINSAGLPTYETKDVGLLQRKWDDYKFDESIVITANEQTQYYQVMLKSVEQFEPQLSQKSTHITHGVVKLQGGVKMSSRKGNIVSALDIIEAARLAGQESGRNPNDDTIMAAIKYAFAKNRIGGDIAYDPKESVALEGNSGPYLQYAHARACSILAKIDTKAGGAPDVADLRDLQPAERSLLRKITEYTEVIDRAAAERMPHHICSYLYELAQAFNSFYEHNRVSGHQRQAIRLTLVAQYAKTIRSGLQLLGIAAPDRL